MKGICLLASCALLINSAWGGVIDSSRDTTRNDKGNYCWNNTIEFSFIVLFELVVLPFLAVVSFPNVECTVGNGGVTTNGVCYSK